MAVETEADRATFVSTDDFGVTATINASGSDVEVSGIFDDEFEMIEVGASVAVAGTVPTFLCRTADLPTLMEEGSFVTIDDVVYIARTIRPDGTGMTRIDLEQTQP